MPQKCQIVPTLASAVHGVTDDFSSTTENLPWTHLTSESGDPRKIFSYFDKNHDGKLTMKEFRSAMQELGYEKVDKLFIRRVFAEANRSGNPRRMTYEEFVNFLTAKSSSAETPQTFGIDNNLMDIEALFNCYDLDKNGFIEPKELRKVMKRLTGEKLSKRDINEMISLADTNGDGLLDKKEFCTSMQGLLIGQIRQSNGQ